MRDAEQGVNEAKVEAQAAYDSASMAKNESESTQAALEDLMDRISEFMLQKGAKPHEIRQVG